MLGQVFLGLTSIKLGWCVLHKDTTKWQVTQFEHTREWLGLADAQADLSLPWEHTHFLVLSCCLFWISFIMWFSWLHKLEERFTNHAGPTG